MATTYQLFKNNANSTISGTLTVGGTNLNLATGQGARFPAISAGEYFCVTLFEKDGGGVEITYEVAKCTAITGDSLTLVRDSEGIVVAAGGTSGGWAYPSAVGVNPSQVCYVQLRFTAYTATNMLAKDANLTGLENNATARTNLGLGSMATAAATDYQAVAGKDATGGYAGLTLFKLNLKNAANTFTNFFTNATTAARTWTLPDKDGTVAMTSDFAAPGAIGGTTPSTGAFSTLSANTSAKIGQHPTFTNIGSDQWASEFQSGMGQGAFIFRVSDANYGGVISLGHSRGTIGANTTIVTNDIVGKVDFSAYDGTSWSNSTAYIASYAEGTVSTGVTPGRLIFSTSSAGSRVPTERLRIDSAGVATFTGAVVSPTAAAGTNTTQVATTAFVFGMRTKAITGTRLLSAASGNVSYTGVGFRPRKVTVYSSISGTLAQSTAQGSATESVCRFVESANPAGILANYLAVIKEYSTPTNYQLATQVSLDADGITIAWTKAGSGTATGDLAFFFEE